MSYLKLLFHCLWNKHSLYESKGMGCLVFWCADCNREIFPIVVDLNGGRK